jgi:NAD(P)-dependent dehydrogenase (short-subunit alcohol dehydrogenase family)
MGAKSVAVVTGASQGIGRATALRLARDFSDVVLAALCCLFSPQQKVIGTRRKQWNVVTFLVLSQPHL